MEKYDDKLSKKLVFIGSKKFRGPVVKRKTTNGVWCCFFILLNVVFVWLSYQTIKRGAPERLTHPMDFRGEICGRERLKSKPYLYFPVPVIDTRVAFCIESCPLETGSYIYLYDTDADNTELKAFNYTKQ
jgi:hypothetical protein